MINANDIPPLASIPPASPREQAEHNLMVAAMAASATVTVKFIKDWSGGDQGGYVMGDTAGFPPGVADSLVQFGFAVRDLDYVPSGPKPVELDANLSTTAASHGDVLIEFVKPWANYMPGDKAGFSADLAHRLTVKGVAVSTNTSPIKRTLRSIRDAISRR